MNPEEMELMTEKNGQEEQEELASESREPQESPLESFAKRQGWRREGSLTAEQYLSKRMERNTSNQYAKDMRVLHQKIDTLREELDRKTSFQLQDRVNSLEVELDEAIDSGDKQRVREISAKIEKAKGGISQKQSSEPYRRDVSEDRRPQNTSDIDGIVEDYIRANQWIGEDEEVYDYVVNEVNFYSQLGVSPNTAITRAANSAKKEFVDRFTKPKEQDTRRFAPPVGTGRTSRASTGELSLNDLGAEDQKIARDYIRMVRSEDPKVTEKSAFAEFMRYQKDQSVVIE